MNFKNLSPNWGVKTLEEIAKKRYGLVDGPFGSDLKSSEYTRDGVPVVRGSNLSLGGKKFDDTYFVFVSEEKARQLERSICYPNDIIFTKKGTLGQTGLIPQNHRFERFLLSSNQMKLSVDETIADPIFVYYFVSSPASQAKIIRNSEATGVPKTNLAYLRTFPIPVPPLEEQKAIAAVLSAFDDKIELNRQMNTTLEEMARALFKSWFVDFDPVRRSAAGGAAQPYDDLFPSELVVDGNGRELPKGWEIRELNKEAEVIKGRSYKSAELEASDTALVTLKSINRGGGYNPNGLKSYTGSYKLDQIISPGELVVAYTDVTQKAEVIGKPAIVQHCPDFDTLVASLDLGIVRPTGEGMSVVYLYQLFQTDDFQNHIFGYTNRSTVLHLNKDGIPVYQFAKPPRPILELYREFAKPILQKIQSNDEESRTLATLRDTLLPRLMSGQLRVPTIDSILEKTL